jgi:uncharacterized integral membrane protein
VQIAFILILLVAIVVATVAFQNTTPVTLTLLLVQITDVSVSLLILVSTAVGAVLMMIFSFGGSVRNRRALRDRDKTIARLEAELADPRARPGLDPDVGAPGPSVAGPIHPPVTQP